MCRQKRGAWHIKYFIKLTKLPQNPYSILIETAHTCKVQPLDEQMIKKRYFSSFKGSLLFEQHYINTKLICTHTSTSLVYDCSADFEWCYATSDNIKKVKWGLQDGNRFSLAFWMPLLFWGRKGPWCCHCLLRREPQKNLESYPSITRELLWGITTHFFLQFTYIKQVVGCGIKSVMDIPEYFLSYSALEQVHHLTWQSAPHRFYPPYSHKICREDQKSLILYPSTKRKLYRVMVIYKIRPESNKLFWAATKHVFRVECI